MRKYFGCAHRSGTMLDKGYVVIDMTICTLTWNNIFGKLKKSCNTFKNSSWMWFASNLLFCLWPGMYMACDKIICNVHDYGKLLSRFCLILPAIITLKFIIVVTYFHSCTWCMLPLVAHITFYHWRFFFFFFDEERLQFPHSWFVRFLSPTSEKRNSFRYWAKIRWHFARLNRKIVLLFNKIANKVHVHLGKLWLYNTCMYSVAVFKWILFRMKSYLGEILYSSQLSSYLWL